MNLDDAVTGRCVVSHPWILDPETGETVPALRIHLNDDDPAQDLVLPLEERDILAIGNGLALQLLELRAWKEDA